MLRRLRSYPLCSVTIILLFSAISSRALCDEKKLERVVAVEVECNPGKLSDFVVRNMQRDAQKKIELSGVERVAAKGTLSIRLFGTKTQGSLPLFTVTTIFTPRAKREGIVVAKTQNVSSFLGQLNAVVDGHVDLYVSTILNLEKRRHEESNVAAATPMNLPANEVLNLETVNRLMGLGELAIMAADGKFLGYVSKDRFDEKSIANRFGDFGGKLGNSSIFNKLSDYGSKVSNKSVSNKLATDPPKLYFDKVAIAYITTNEQLTPRIHPDVLAVVIDDR